MTIDGETKLLDIIDTATGNYGDYGHHSMREQQIRFGDGFFIVYSIVRRSSFNQVRNIISDIVRVKSEAMVS